MYMSNTFFCKLYNSPENQTTVTQYVRYGVFKILKDQQWVPSHICEMKGSLDRG
jgi:hypothetical protein